VQIAQTRKKHEQRVKVTKWHSARRTASSSFLLPPRPRPRHLREAQAVVEIPGRIQRVVRHSLLAASTTEEREGLKGSGVSSRTGAEERRTRTHGDEHEELRAAVESRRHEVVVLAEPCGAVAPEVELGEDGEEHRREDGRVDADRQVAEAPARDRRHELVKVHPAERVQTSARDREGNG